MKINKTVLGLIVLCALLALTTGYFLATSIVVLFPQHHYWQETRHYDIITGPETGFHSITFDIHASIKQYRWIDGHKYLIYSYEHPAALTQISENYTAAKISGDTGWNLTDYANNVTYIALGHDVGLSTSSTELPGEWNRTAATFEYIGIGNWNYSASFYPGGSGSTNATSLNWLSGIGTNLSMWAYDTFTTIDYTSNDQIDVEWMIDIQYS